MFLILISYGQLYRPSSIQNRFWNIMTYVIPFKINKITGTLYAALRRIVYLLYLTQTPVSHPPPETAFLKNTLLKKGTKFNNF